MRRARLISLLLCAISAAPAAAQWQLSGDVGASHLRQSGLPESNAMTLGGTLDFTSDRFALRTSALSALAGDARLTGQWLAAGVVSTPAWRSLALDVTGSVSAFGQSSLRPTSSADVVVQGRFGDGARGIAAGGGYGRTAHNGASIPNRRLLADGWWSIGPERFAVNVTRTRTRAVFGESSILVDISRREMSYLDLAGSWRHDGASWSLGATLGERGRDETLNDARAWQSIDAEFWMAPHAALVVGIGRTLEDLVRGVPHADYATLALRLSGPPHLHMFARRAALDGPRLVVTAGPSGTRRIELDARGASHVELMADFTGWSPVTLERGSDRWSLTRAVAPGLHRVAIRIDGGEWTAPANLPKIEDDLGGTVGLITVP